jgi:hypothetical protein
VRAVDVAGNLSLYSDTVDIKTAMTGLDQTECRDIRVYPNPSEDIINIESERPGEFRVIILDLLGKEVFSDNFRGKIVLNKSDIGRPGVYIIRITGELNEYTTRLMIQ